jgi:thermitase
MKVKLLVLCGILWLLTPAGAAEGPPVAKGKLGFGFAPGLVAGKDFVAGQLIVGMQEGATIQAVRSAAAAQRGRVAKEIAGQALLLEFDAEAAAAGAVHQLLATPEVAFVERNGFMSIPPHPQLPADLKGQRRSRAAGGDMTVATVSGDKGTGYQWHLTVIRKTATLPTLSTTPPTVAVLDTGVDYTHTDLSGKVFRGKNTVANTMDPMDDHGHGTHCAGLIAAKAGNTYYGEGVCPACKILAVKVLTAAGWGTFFDIANGMAWTIANRGNYTPNVKVVNMSLGGSASSAIATQVLAMKNAGMVLAAAAGNANSSTEPSYPGADPNTALRVMATEENDTRAYFSNFSPATSSTLYNIAAPGYEIYSTLPAEGFGPMSGTSMATPIVAGSAALVWGELPTLTRGQLVSRLITNGKSIAKGFAASTRRVDVRKAITAASEAGLVGRILDPFTGEAHSPNTTADTASLWNGATQVASDATNNKSGAYEMTGLTTGARTLRASRTTPALPVANMRNVTISSGTVAGPYTDAKPRARTAGYASITLDWRTTQPITDTTGCIDACNGWEFDLFVRQPSGTLIYWGNNGDLTGSPYVFYPRDSLDDLEPLETIVIGPSAANGAYRVFVDKWSSSTTDFNPSWANSLASVQVFKAAALFQNYQAAPGTCGTLRYWHVGNLTKNGNTYTWTGVNTCSNTIP